MDLEPRIQQQLTNAASDCSDLLTRSGAPSDKPGIDDATIGNSRVLTSVNIGQVHVTGIERGHCVRAVVRSDDEIALVSGKGAEAVTGDILERETLVPAVQRCDMALHRTI